MADAGVTGSGHKSVAWKQTFNTASDDARRIVARVARDGVFRGTDIWVTNVTPSLIREDVLSWSDEDRGFVPAGRFDSWLSAHGMADEYLLYHQRVGRDLEDIAMVDEEVAEKLAEFTTIAGKVGYLTGRLSWTLREIDELSDTVTSLQNQVADLERRSVGLEVTRAELRFDNADVYHRQLGRLADPDE